MIAELNEDELAGVVGGKVDWRSIRQGAALGAGVGGMQGALMGATAGAGVFSLPGAAIGAGLGTVGGAITGAVGAWSVRRWFEPAIDRSIAEGK
jgi:uncharacterized membrane protein